MQNWAKIFIADSRKMVEVADNSVQLIVTSPPYWSIKDYGVKHQIGYGQTLHEYLKDLYRVWKESYRVLEPGRRIAINIGDQFARAVVFGRYKVIPLHAEIIAQCEHIGFDYMGAIIWQKKTTMNTTGGANVMGSYPYPPNGLVEIDYEYILIFKKPGKSKKVPPELKEASRLTIDEWKKYFYGHWHFGGARQIEHEAMFPDELPRRLIKMFTFKGETVLDPFLGSGTTAKVALELGRNFIGYEINENFREIIEKKVGISRELSLLSYLSHHVEIRKRNRPVELEPVKGYHPTIKDAKPIADPQKMAFREKKYHKVVDIHPDCSLKLDSGITVKFKGVQIKDIPGTLAYLKSFILHRKVWLKFDDNDGDGSSEAYVYLKNGIFVNAYLIKSGLATAVRERDYKMKERFIEFENQKSIEKAPSR